MGGSQNGSTTGLHFDYHDNFYILLKGTKIFRLHSPDQAEFIKVYGKAKYVHSNGLISYSKDVQSDGHISDDNSN